jgi:hypothetical protein
LIETPGTAGDDRRRKVRRTAILLGLVAFAFYATFIAMSVIRASR